MSEQDFPTLSAPGTTPKITSLFDFSAEALGQLKFWLEQAGLNIPISQVIGFTQFVGQAAAPAEGSSTTTSTTYADTGDALGPEITELPKGRYLIQFGASTSNSGTNNTFMSVKVNTTEALDVDACVHQSTALIGVSRAVVKDLSEANNTIRCRYRVGAGTGLWTVRWLTATRIANL